MEGLYRRMIGPVDPRTPNQSFKIMIFFMKFVGVYPPDNKSPWVQRIHAIYSVIIRVLVLHFFVFFQVVFLWKVSDIKEVADALFLTMTQISLAYKMEIYFRNRYRLKAAVERLNCDLFRPQTADEDQIFKETMVFENALHVFFASTPTLHMTGMMAGSLSARALLMPAWYPIDLEPLPNYILVWLYQVLGLAFSAMTNITVDTVGACLLLHSKCQIQRLGLRISNIGYEKSLNREIDSREPTEFRYWDQEMTEIDKKIDFVKSRRGDNYGELTRCIIVHKKILEYIAEVQDMFKRPVFCQFLFSSLIICMTLVAMANQEHLSDALKFVAYLGGISGQIFVYCYAGNEVKIASNQLPEMLYNSNFPDFDTSTGRSLIFFMKRVMTDIQVKAGTLFQVSLSLETFMAIIQSSYSYFAVLRTMQDK